MADTDQLRATLGKLTLFQATSPECIRDVRDNIPRMRQEHKCQDYQRLFEAVYNAAFWLSRAAEGTTHEEQAFLDILHEDLRHWEQQYRVFREHDGLPTEFRCRYRHSTIAHAFRVVCETIDAVGQSLRLTPNSIDRDAVLRQIFDAFTRHGPDTYPKVAIYAAMALILNGVGIPNKHGSPYKPDAIQRELNRST
jgi:hypothetical protein